VTTSEPLLEVVDLQKLFPLGGGAFGTRRGTIHAVDGVSFTIEKGRTFALVGESGCGKSTTARLILQLERPTGGSIRFRGADVTRMRRSELKGYKKAVQAVFQDPFSSLSPRMRVRDIIGEPLSIHENLGGRKLAARVSELLDQVGLQQAAGAYYPHQFSGGQRQRIAIARALSLNPEIIVLDEPVSALDVSIRAQILNLLADLQDRLGLSYLLISHDLAIVEHMSHAVGVMYAGKIVEMAPGPALYGTPLHPYTQALIAAVPIPDPTVPVVTVVGGEVPNPAHPPSGCRFHPRCPLNDPSICPISEPQLLEEERDHLVACFRVDEARRQLVKLEPRLAGGVEQPVA
jgi:oligopeptide/dipeptide ABC transporter ATP-binding protein